MQFKLFKNKSNRIITIIVILITTSVLFFLHENYIMNEANSICLHKKILGFDCPLCGLTRSVYMFIHLDFKQAIEFNFVIIPLFVLLLIEIISFILKNKYLDVAKKYMFYLIISAFIIIYIFRIYIHFFK